MIEVKGGKFTHNFELMRNSNKSSITLSRAPHPEAEFNKEGGGVGEGVCPPGLAQIKEIKENDRLKKFLFFRF